MINLTFDPCYQRDTSDQNIQSKFQAMKDLFVDSGEEITPTPPKPGKIQFRSIVFSILIMQEIENSEISNGNYLILQFSTNSMVS